MERKEIKRNGYGRRPYDGEFIEHCLNCDMRKEIRELQKTKASWKLVILIVGGAMAIAGFFLAPLLAELSEISKISERTATIEAQQELIITNFGIKKDP